MDIKKLEMPTIYAIGNINSKLKIIYGITILISIFTTALSLGISFLKNINKGQKIYNKISKIICLSAIAFSTIGFSKLVKLIYPILGVLGLIQIIQILKYKIIAKKQKN